jgi:hypothetical protein
VTSAWPGAVKTVRTPLRRAAVVALSLLAVTGGLSTRAGATAAPREAPESRAHLCRTASLRLIRGPDGGAQGRGYAVLDLANASGSSCDLDGFPGIGLLRPDGRPVRLRVVKTTRKGFASPAVSEAPVRLVPGSTVDFWMEWVQRVGRSRGFMKVTPPGRRRAIEITNRSVELDVGSVTVSPVTSRVLTS